MEHKKFTYKTKEELMAEAARVGVELPYTEDLSSLLKPAEIGGKTLGNRMVIQPLEGCDANDNGGPGEQTRRRYQRFSAGGAGLIWFEATAIVSEGRAQARQLTIHDGNVEEYKRLVDEIKELGMRSNGYEPVIIHQLTHSGRYSKPHGVPEPLIAWNNPILEKENPISQERILSDDYLKGLTETYYKAAKMSKAAGFDGMDVKACHGYLGSELLGAFLRPGRYGGSYENRTRFLKESLDAVRSAVGEKHIVTTRLSLSDCFPYPHGFGMVQQEGSRQCDLTEPLRLIRELKEKGLKLLNTSIASPYVNPHISRPYDRGGYIPDEHPLEGVGRFLRLLRAVQKENPDLEIINAGFSYLRQFLPYVAAGALETGAGTLAGFGRALFANPDLPRQLRETGKADKSMVCVSCSLCTDHLRKGICTGCFVRDRENYHD